MNKNKIRSLVDQIMSADRILIDGNKVDACLLSGVRGYPNNEIILFDGDENIGGCVSDYRLTLTEYQLDQSIINQDEIRVIDQAGQLIVIELTEFKRKLINIEW